MDNIRKFYRSAKNKVIAGVCGGIAEYYNVDPTLIRAGYVILAIFTALAPCILLYFILWMLVPKRPSEE